MTKKNNMLGTFINKQDLWVIPCQALLIMENYLKKQIADGYITKTGHPIKCITCDSKEFKDNIIDQTEQGIMEYEMVCIKCEQVNGLWSYGYWQV